MDFFTRYRGPIPDAASIVTAEDARQYLMPWLYPGFGDQSSDESDSDSETSDSNSGHGRGGQWTKAAAPTLNSEESDYDWAEEEEDAVMTETEEVAETEAAMDVASDFSDDA